MPKFNLTDLRQGAVVAIRAYAFGREYAKKKFKRKFRTATEKGTIISEILQNDDGCYVKIRFPDGVYDTGLKNWRQASLPTLLADKDLAWS